MSTCGRRQRERSSVPRRRTAAVRSRLARPVEHEPLQFLPGSRRFGFEPASDPAETGLCSHQGLLQVGDDLTQLGPVRDGGVG
jgi:hypothetical protein